MVALLHRTCPGQESLLGTGYQPALETLGWALGYAKAESWSLGSGDSCCLLQEVCHDFLNLSHFEMGRVGEDGRRQRPSLQVGRVNQATAEVKG